ncbi:MAG: tRNA (adenosine(37)-N6)-dimethylallyltransferase MiaA [Pseudomonadota bacterium]
MPAQETPVLIVAGPTASGKSSAAAHLGRMLSGAVINADSMQVYRDLRVLTARPSAEDQRRVPHHLYGHVDGAERYSAGRFVTDSTPIIQGLRAEGTIPILCGGTGLYLKALTDGLSPVPEVPGSFTAHGNALWDEDPAAFREAVLECDPPMQRLDPSDRQRHVRAWAVAQVSDTPLSEWQQKPRERALDALYIPAVLLPDRDTLYAACDARFEMMLDSGAFDEVRRLLARGLPPDLPVMKALGVPELAAVLRGDLSETDAIDLAKQETRRFAKRQMTWLRNQTDWPVFDTSDGLVDFFVKKLVVKA